MRIFLGAATLAALCGPVGADAHAILTGGTPALGATLPAGKLEMALRFNSRVDAARSRVTLAHDTDAPAIVALDPDPAPGTLTATVPVVAGAYVLKWQVLATDGHITRGVVLFTVGGP